MLYSPVLLSLNLQISKTVLSLSKIERYYILDFSSSGPHYIFTVTGSSGNEYFITFTKSRVSCTCDNKRSNPCKHIIFNLRVLGFRLKCGNMTMPCTRITDSIQKFTHSKNMPIDIFVDICTLQLCTNHYQTCCHCCKQHLDSTILSHTLYTKKLTFSFVNCVIHVFVYLILTTF